MFFALNEPQTFLDWAQFGVVGTVVVGFIFGWIWPKPSVDRLQKDLDRAITKLDERDAFDREVVVPAITTNNEVVKEALGIIRRLSDRLDTER